MRARSHDLWRGLTWKRVRLAAVAGLALGATQGVGVMMGYKDADWTMMVESVPPMIAYAAFLLLALTAAANVVMMRAPRWLPFAVAAVIALALGALVDFATQSIVPALVTGNGGLEMMDVALYAWNGLPVLLIIAICASFGAMQAVDAARRTSALRTVQLERTRVAREAYEARLAALQARVEPAFLFETLSDVEALYERDASLGARVLEDLIVYLRAALPEIEGTSSTLKAEITLARTWLDIVRIRSGDRLTFAIPDVGQDARMPPMLLLPLVQHAAGDVRDAERAVMVSTAITGERVRLTVTGPAPAFARPEAPAIVEVGERLRALYGDHAGLAAQPAAHDRSQINLEIPYERADRSPR